MVVGVDRERLAECADCLHGEGSACEAACPMRLRPRSIKRLMFACTQCAQCLAAVSYTHLDVYKRQMWSWVALILYFTTIHATLVLLGMFGLARAMNGQPFRFPLIGPREVA